LNIVDLSQNAFFLTCSHTSQLSPESPVVASKTTNTLANMPKVSPDLSHLDAHLSLEHDHARENRRSRETVPDRQGSSVLPHRFDRAQHNADPRGSNGPSARTPTERGYEGSMTGSSLKSTSGYSSVTTSPSYEETRSFREGGERRQSPLGQLLDKAKTKLSRRPSGTETVAK